MTTKTRTTTEQSPAVLEESGQLALIEEAADKYSLVTLQALPRFQQALMLAKGIAELRKLLMPLMGKFLPLMNTKLGFKTDRTPPKDNPYPVETVCDCLIEATIRGLRPVGNEFNIISSSCYTTKEGYIALLAKFPGLTDLKLMPSVPIAKQNGAVVHYKATWRLHGTPDSIEREIPIRVNAGSGADQILGKAGRKIRAAIYEQITGSPQSGLDGDVEDGPDGLPRESKSDQVLAKLQAKQANGGGEAVASKEQVAQIKGATEALQLPAEAVEEWCRENGCNPQSLSAKQAEACIAWLEEKAERVAIETQGEA